MKEYLERLYYKGLTSPPPPAKPVEPPPLAHFARWVNSHGRKPVRIYLYALALTVKEAHCDGIRGTVFDHHDHYEVFITVKVPKSDEPMRTSPM